MSTKIYNAYRCPIKVFYKDFLPAINGYCIKKAASELREQMGHIPDVNLREFLKKHQRNPETGELLSKTIEIDKFLEAHDKRARLRYVFVEAYRASKSLVRDYAFCIDASLNVWLYNNRAYVIPYGDYFMFKNFKLPTGVEDYSYWNNTDPPEELSKGEGYKQWERRGKVWDKICDDWDGGRLVHTIVSVKERIGIVEVCRQIVPKEEAWVVYSQVGYDED